MKNGRFLFIFVVLVVCTMFPFNAWAGDPVSPAVGSGFTIKINSDKNSGDGLSGAQTVCTAGTGYAVGDILYLNGDYGFGGSVRVDKVGKVGEVSAVSVNSAGKGYVNGSIVATTDSGPDFARFKYIFISGTEYSTVNNFSSGQAFVEYSGNILFADINPKASDSNNVYNTWITNGFADVQMTQIPVSSSQSGGANQPALTAGSGSQQQSFAMTIGLESRFWNIPGNDSDDYFVGLIGKYGFNSANSTGGKLWNNLNLGFRVGQTDKLKYGGNNPVLLSYLDVGTGLYENLGYEKWKVVINGYLHPLRFPLFFSVKYIGRTGFDTNDKGPDDLRLLAGLEFDISKFSSFATAAKPLFGN